LVVFLCFFTKMAIAGESETTDQMRLSAMAYEHGRDGIKLNFRRAFELYCKAALRGDAESAYNLGFMYFNGRGMPRDLALAVRWFKQAAEAGDFQAQNMVARFSDVELAEDTSCRSTQAIINPVADFNPKREKIAAWVNKIAPVYGIDPQLVMAVIQAESAFNTDALSAKNAQGLMQLIPETAERFGVKDSLNPVQNIKGGTAYLHWLMRHFGGKVDMVLAAYNAGEGAVERYKGIPPYEETRNYVKQIKAWYPWQRHPVPPENVEQIAMLEAKI